MNEQDWLNKALALMHDGQWFGWRKEDDNGNKIPNDQRMTYENVIVHDSLITKPTEAEVNAKIQELKGTNSTSSNYEQQRRNAYPKIGDQLDMLWHTMDKDMELQNKFYDFYQTIKKVKVAHPKK